MSVHVALQIELREKLSCTFITLKSFYSLVHLHMLVEIGSLSKWEVTPLFTAFKRTLPCVNTKVIEEIMPFFETFITSSMRTEQLLYNTFWSWVLQLKDEVICCLWNLTVFDLLGQLCGRIKLAAWCNLNFEVRTLKICKQAVFFLDLWKR